MTQEHLDEVNLGLREEQEMGSKIKGFSRSIDGRYEWTEIHDDGRRPQRRRTGPAGRGLFELRGKRKPFWGQLFLPLGFCLHPTDEAQALRELHVAVAREEEGIWEGTETLAQDQSKNQRGGRLE
jgi:hypothetical protein